MKHHPYSRRLPQRGLVHFGRLVSLLVIARGETGHAQVSPAESTRVRLRVESTADCASEGAIVSRVQRRSQQIVFSSTGPYAASLHASVQPDDRGTVRAILRVQHDGRDSDRRIEAASCAEAIDALALLVVLTLDPDAAGRLEPSPDDGVTSSPEAPRAARTHERRSRAPGRVPLVQTAPQTTLAAAPSPEPAPSGVTEPAANSGKARAAAGGGDPPREEGSSAGSGRALSPSPAARWALAAGLAGRGLLGAAPGLMPGIGLFVQLAWERESVWSPAVRLSAAHGWLSGIREPGGRADFELQGVSLDLCVVRWRWGPAAVRGCGSGALGRFSASGSETYHAAAYTRALATLGGSVLVSVALPAQLGLYAMVGFGVPWSRDAFAFRPEVFHRVAPVLVDLGLGVGARFP